MIKLTFLGDVMCKAEMVTAYKTDSGYNFDTIFENMKDYFNESDYVLSNMETPISFDNSNLTDEQWRFNSPYEFAESAFKSGIHFAATANNHCLDRGKKGIESTVKALNKIGFAHTGVFSSEKKKPLIINVKGIKFGILAYTYGTNAFSNNEYLGKDEKYMVNLFQEQELNNSFLRYCYHNKNKKTVKIINRILGKFKRFQMDKPIYERTGNDKHQKEHLLREIFELKVKDVDYIIMYMHAGGQYNSSPTEYTVKLADYLIQHGVDIVAGSHEHVVHGGDFSNISKGKLVTYSLGNFDGIAGVYDKPFDKMAEYSIAWNIYFDELKKTIIKTTFSVLKTIECENKKVPTIPLYDLIAETAEADEKKKLERDAVKIAEIFSGKLYDGIQKEYSI